MSADRPLRLFVALELPAAARAALAAFRDAAVGETWRPVPDAALHVTLAFLGARPPGDVPAIEPLLARLGTPAPLALGGALLLPPRRARVLAAALDDRDGALGAAQAELVGRLAAADLFTPEKRPFRPHVTVGRLRPRATPPREVAAAPERVAFTGEDVTLFVSRLHPRGARYEALAGARLSGA